MNGPLIQNFRRASPPFHMRSPPTVRAAKFILSLPYRSEVSYKQRLLKNGLLPLCYWHESSFSHPTVFKTILLVSFRRRLLTSRKLAIHGPPLFQISVTKEIDNSVQWSVLLSTIALAQSTGKKSPSHCKKLIATNYVITLVKGSYPDGEDA